MLMLYANRIIKNSTDNLERLITDKSCIKMVIIAKNPKTPIVLYVKLYETEFRIELKPNKNFDTIAGFFEYIRGYSEIVFETKEVPVNKNDSQITIKDIINSEEMQNEIFDILINILKKQHNKTEESEIKMIQAGDIFYKNKEKIIIIDDYGDEFLALVKNYSNVYFKIYHNVDEIFKNYSFVKNDEKLVSNLIECVSKTLGEKL